MSEPTNSPELGAAGEAAASTDPSASIPVLPPEHWAQEALGEGDRHDSAIGGINRPTSLSLTSSILTYRTIQGRTYHSERGGAQYWGTNDDGHNESLDILHHCLTLCLDGELYLAPLDKPKKALDVGTGTGLWAIDFADKFPDCQVTGTDVSPIQPTWIPSNLQFEIEDCTQEWTFPMEEFDYVHIRYLVGSIADWTALFRQAFQVLKPGAYLESYEATPNTQSDDGTLPPDSALAQWGQLFVDGGRALGRSFTVVEDNVQRRAMEEAGFVDIQERNIKCPVGGWARDAKWREIGQYAQLAIIQDIEGFILFMTTVQNWTREQVEVYMAHLRRELRSGEYHSYYCQKIMWGRKPET